MQSLLFMCVKRVQLVCNLDFLRGCKIQSTYQTNLILTTLWAPILTFLSFKQHLLCLQELVVSAEHMASRNKRNTNKYRFTAAKSVTDNDDYKKSWIRDTWLTPFNGNQLLFLYTFLPSRY